MSAATHQFITGGHITVFFAVQFSGTSVLSPGGECGVVTLSYQLAAIDDFSCLRILLYLRVCGQKVGHKRLTG